MADADPPQTRLDQQATAASDTVSMSVDDAQHDQIDGTVSQTNSAAPGQTNDAGAEVETVELPDAVAAVEEDVAQADTGADKGPKDALAENGFKEVKDSANKEAAHRTAEKEDNTRVFSKADREYLERSNNSVYATYYSNRSSRENKRNIKSRYDHLPETSDASEIRQQLEFYFVQSNLCRDEHMFKQIGGTQNNAVDLKSIATFKRMHRFKPYSAIVEAVKESAILDLIVDSSGQEQVKRKEPLPSEFGSEYNLKRLAGIEDARRDFWLYAKGFGQEDATTQTDVEDYFRQFGPVVSVILRRTNPMLKFKGSVFIEFPTVDLLDQFLALETKPKYKGTRDLIFMSKKEYEVSKKEQIASGNFKANTRSDWTDRGNRRGGRHSRGRSYRGGRGHGGSRNDRFDQRGDKDDWNRRRDNFQKSNRFHGGGRRDGRDKKGRNGADSDDEPVPRRRQEYDEKGIPIVRATTHDDEMDDLAAERRITAYNDKKRARDSDSDNDEAAEKKKSKKEPIDPNFPRRDA